MRYFILILLFICSTAFASPKNIIIVSVDALHPDAVNENITPNILKLYKDGSYTLKGISVDPPKTLLSHTAIFTGLEPKDNGKLDNNWKKGESVVGKPTIFNLAKEAGYKTYFIYSKGKLGYLVNNAVDISRLSKEEAVLTAEKELENASGKTFMFLHVSGLDMVGPEFGWLSPEYLEEAKYIDEDLGVMLNKIIEKGDYLIVITSDHAGHEKMHGCRHPEDYKLPFGIVSDSIKFPEYQDKPYKVTQLYGIIESLIK